MSRQQRILMGCGLIVGLVGSVVVVAQPKGKPAEESERRVKESEVPKVALDALKKAAGGLTLTEFAEEIEHGHKFYEGSWKGPDGGIDCLVTETGDMVELEEKIPASRVPAAVLAESVKQAGSEAAVHFEKKTFYVYEIHFKKGGKGHEMIFTPDGRRFYEDGGAPGKEEENDHDEDD